MVEKKKKHTKKPQNKEMTLSVMIEIPKGCRNKYEYDKKNKVFRFDRMLYSAVHYPSDYGFIPDTLSLDGDPLDVLVLMWEPTFPGCVIDVRPVGMFRMWDEKGQDEKVLCVPVNDPLWNHTRSLEDVPPHLLAEIEHFFSIYKDLEKKKTKIDGWHGISETIKVIKEARTRHKKKMKR